jgi:thiamine biosynthesis lipoprotein
MIWIHRGGWLGLLVLLLAGCDRRPEEIAFAGTAFASSYHVKVVDAGAAFSQETGPAAVQALLDELDIVLSTYKPDSELNRLNRQPVGVPFVASAALWQVLAVSKRIYEITEGAFDPTVRPLVDLWGFGPVDTGDRIPSDAEIAGLKRRLGFDKIELKSGNVVVRRADVTLDLSAIGGGYAADRVAELLEMAGATNYMVEITGEIRVRGHNRDGRSWRLAVERPAEAQGGVAKVLRVTDSGLATSGDYRNYFERDGVRYSHEIDPRSGRPITNNLASITVFTATAAEADALATALMIMGPERARRFGEANDLAMFLVTRERDGFVESYTSQLKSYLSEDQP